MGGWKDYLKLELPQHSTKVTVPFQCIFKVYLANPTTLPLTRNLLEARFCLFGWVGGWIPWKYRYPSHNLNLWLDTMHFLVSTCQNKPLCLWWKSCFCLETFCLDRWLAGYPKNKAISAPTTTRDESNAFLVSTYQSKQLCFWWGCCFVARNYLSGWVGGRPGGWIFRKYSQLSPQLKLGLGWGWAWQ